MESYLFRRTITIKANTTKTTKITASNTLAAIIAAFSAPVSEQIKCLFSLANKRINMITTKKLEN